MKIGFDVDGVLADFNTSFINRVIEVTGEDRFPARPFDIPVWHYPNYYGYTAPQVSDVWDSVKADPMFWASLLPYTTAITALDRLYRSRDDVYFITSRMGANVKRQTEGWLQYYGAGPTPTVLISGHKGACAAALHLDAYIDDYWSNITDVLNYREVGTPTRVFVLDQPWNRAYSHPDVIRVKSPLEMLDLLFAPQA